MNNITHENAEEYPGESTKTAVAVFMAGALLAASGIVAKEAYEFVHVQPNVEQVYDNIVGPSHG